MDYINLNELIEYVGEDAVAAKDAMRFIHSASRHIDTLTYGRINKYGFDNLTEFQQNIIKESTALQTKFESDNDDLLSSPLNSYSINGVSMSFGGNWNMNIINGVAAPADVCNLLAQSGLTTLSLSV